MKEILNGQIKTAIFDMDGTIYRLDGENGGFKNSSLHKKMTGNAVNFISQRENIPQADALSYFESLTKKHSHPSLILSKKYQIPRKEFFDIVWDVNPEGIVIDYEDAVHTILELAKKNIELILLTQAPSKWQDNVFNFLGFNELFSEIFTGEFYLDKTDIFPKIAVTRDPDTVISIGDQLETDITPAQTVGFQTLFVNHPKELLKLIEYE